MVTSEHLDWHKNVREYVDAKSSIVRFQAKMILRCSRKTTAQHVLRAAHERLGAHLFRRHAYKPARKCAMNTFGFRAGRQGGLRGGHGKKKKSAQRVSQNPR